MIYEAHITFAPEAAPVLRDLADRGQLTGWKVSQIDGDPDMGDRTFCYLSAHGSDEAELRKTTLMLAHDLRALGVHALRAKTEMVVFDQRYFDPADRRAP